MDELPDELTDGRTDERTDGRKDKRTKHSIIHSFDKDTRIAALLRVTWHASLFAENV